MPSEQQSPPAPARARPSKKIAKRATKRASHILQEHISEGREGYTLKEETQPVQNSALLHGPDDGATTLVVGREYQSASSVAKKNVALSNEGSEVSEAEILDGGDKGDSSDGEDGSLQSAVTQAVDALVSLDPEDLESAMHEVRNGG